MRRTALRLTSCALAGAALVLVAAPASAEPAHDAGRELPGVSSAPLNAPPMTHFHGRKL